MTLTDWLLLVLIVAAVVRIVQAERHHQALVKWLDAMGDLIGDLLRGVLDELRKRP